MDRNQAGQFIEQPKPVAVIVQRSESYWEWESVGSDSLGRLQRYLAAKGYRVQVVRLPKQGKRIAHGL